VALGVPFIPLVSIQLKTEMRIITSKGWCEGKTRSCALEGPTVMSRGQGLLGLGFCGQDLAGRLGSFSFCLGSSSETAVRDPAPLQPSCRDPSGTFRSQPCTNPLLSPTDRISIRSYRTDISMSDFENSRDFEGRDNMGASPEAQETSLGGKDGTSLPGGLPSPGVKHEPRLCLWSRNWGPGRADAPSPALHTEFATTTEDTVESKEPKKAKRVRPRREKEAS